MKQYKKKIKLCAALLVITLCAAGIRLCMFLSLFMI